MRTLSEIRREIRSLQPKYQRELTIYRLRRVTEQVKHDYARAVADRREPLKPLEIIRRIADQDSGSPPGFACTTTWTRCGNRERSPKPAAWYRICCPGSGRRNTTDS